MKIRTVAAASVTVGLVASVLAATPGQAAPDPDQPRNISFESFDARTDFRAGQFDDVYVRGNRLALRYRTDDTITYRDPFGDKRKRRYDVGSWTSPVVELGFGASEAVPSWNAKTPTGTWVETRFRGRHDDGTWTKWYVMGRWTSGMNFKRGDIHRTTVGDQGDDDGTVWTDTFAAEDG